MGGSPTSFRREQARKNTLNLKNRASLANKATMSVSHGNPQEFDCDMYLQGGDFDHLNSQLQRADEK